MNMYWRLPVHREHCTEAFCSLMYRQHCAFRGAVKRRLKGDTRAALPQVVQQSKSSRNNIQGVKS